ncbi:MAG: N-acetylmuramoyl-L-alanine amidase [Bacteroidales bacterium]|nr:N-acetylmuramoyl-L-alanine amidase [Bacteroidales bacterium]
MNEHKDIYKFLLFIFCFFSAFFCFSQNEEGKNVFDKVVIDAGHGGNKPGALGTKFKEKDITLAVAIKLGKLINEHLKSVKVYYTRVIDQDIDLYKRSSVANKINADLFLSIHCNSATAKTAGGTETYAMGLGKTESNLEVAKKENAEILTEKGSLENYQGFDLNSPEGDILFSLYQNAYLQNSLDFAAKVQSQYTKNVPMKNRGVHQANFVVLWKAAMPAVLTEIGFISNPKEEEYIGSEYGQWTIAACIFRAICEYRNKVDNLTDAIPSIEKLIPQEVQEKENIRKQNEQIEQQRKQEEQKQIAEKQKQEQQIAQQKQQKERAEQKKKEGIDLVYRVQFLSSPTQLNNNDSRIADLEDVFSYNEKGSWKYTAGLFASQQEALDYQKKVKEKYADAFVVAFYQGKRVSIVEAKRLSSQKTQ